MHERAGSFVNWEGRVRPFDAVIPQPNGMSDLRVLAALADGLGVDLGFRTAAQAQAELDELGAWEGERGAPGRPMPRGWPAPSRPNPHRWCWRAGVPIWTAAGRWTASRT